MSFVEGGVIAKTAIFFMGAGLFYLETSHKKPFSLWGLASFTWRPVAILGDLSHHLETGNLRATTVMLQMSTMWYKMNNNKMVKVGEGRQSMKQPYAESERCSV